MLLFHAPNPRACGIAELNEQQQIMSFEEKPSEPKSDFANAGVYVVDAPIYRQIAQMKAFDLGFDVLPKFIGKMRGWIWEGYHRDMGTYPTYLQAQRDAVELFPSKNCRPAVFLDRDGTVIEQVHYLSKPEQVKLLPDSGEAIKQLRKAGFACILVTNQAAVGHGLLTEENLREIHQVLIDQLAQQGAELDGFYYCTKTSSLKDRTVVEYYDRKPGPGMLFKAAMELQLDLKRSWMIGDMISDLLAGYHANCNGLIRVATGPELKESENVSSQISWYEMANLVEASQFILTRTFK
jgi:D-glycero-D-manno-heptose 1,7-bisphosphate phosphatase